MRITYGISEEIGWRRSMEDEHAVYRDDAREFFAADVYDGHGGKEPARIASRTLTPYFMQAWVSKTQTPSAIRHRESKLLREAYMRVDAHIAENGVEGGATAANFYILGERFMAANAGDTRVIMGVEEGVLLLTEDHKAGLSEEKERVEGLGGEVIVHGVPRVQGILAVSRALGDTMLKPYVTAEPRVVEGCLGVENDYAVLACDGVWDVLTPEEVIDIVRSAADPELAARAVSRLALDKGSMDNITVISVDLRVHTRRLKRRRMEIIEVTDYANEIDNWL
jgi:protein phosphatase 1L